jgi:prevent-host-death family protein
MSEASVSIAELKARLSQYVRRARAGEVVVVTDRGHPVARLGPLEGAVALEGHLAQLAGAGLIKRPTVPLASTFLDQPRPADPEGRSLEIVLEERAGGW